MKYTLLPPQKAPKQATAHRHVPNLGEHRQAFLNSHNQHGWVAEPTPEQPESDAMMALAATLLVANRKVHKPVRGKLLKANQIHQSLVPRGNPADIDADIFRKPVVKSIVIPGSPLDEYMRARASGKIYDIANPSPLLDSEYQARRKLILGDPSIEEHVKSVGEIVERHAKFRKHLVGSYSNFTFRTVIDSIIPPLNNRTLD